MKLTFLSNFAPPIDLWNFFCLIEFLFLLPFSLFFARFLSFTGCRPPLLDEMPENGD